MELCAGRPTFGLVAMPRGATSSRRAGVRHSFPYQVNTRTFGSTGLLRVDQTMCFYDLEDVLTLALGSAPMGRRSVAGWRRGLKGDNLGRLLARPAVGVVLPEEIIKIKWTEANRPCKGRARVAATPRACDAILSLVAESRATQKGKPPPKMHQWLIARRDRQPPELYMEHAAILEQPRTLPDALACIADVPFDTWKLSDAEMESGRVHL